MKLEADSFDLELRVLIGQAMERGVDGLDVLTSVMKIAAIVANTAEPVRGKTRREAFMICAGEVFDIIQRDMERNGGIPVGDCEPFWEPPQN
jgi:hypothetical protein